MLTHIKKVKAFRPSNGECLQVETEIIQPITSAGPMNYYFAILDDLLVRELLHNDKSIVTLEKARPISMASDKSQGDTKSQQNEDREGDAKSQRNEDRQEEGSREQDENHQRDEHLQEDESLPGV